MFSANLRGNEESLFKPGVIGVEHIVLNADDYWERFYTDEQNFDGLRIDTYCGRNLKFNSNYSRFRKHAGLVRNACEYCFTEWEPVGKTFSDKQRAKRIQRESENLPF